MPRKTQKQIAQRYSGNLRYFKSLDPMRRARLLGVFICFIISTAAALIYLGISRHSLRIENLNSPGGISQAHAQFAQDCKQCHDPTVKLNLLKPPLANASLDANCEHCHTQHTFHQVDVVVDHSCTDCHHEHLGTGPMQPVADSNCLSCHGNSVIMAASAQKGLELPKFDFHVLSQDDRLVYFQPLRPVHGYTQVFQSFEDGHPPFQIQREHLSDSTTLKFNHKIHLSGNIPMVDGRKLDCAYCHKPDSRGAYMQAISFAKDCQACHALQIDPTLPDFQIPHPTGTAQVDSVRNFLLTLPTEYASYATEKKGLTDPNQIAGFVNQHMTVIRQRARQGNDLVKDVFYDDKHALFPGCAYCHEVKPSQSGEPVVTPPLIPDRWFVHARFNHAAHITMDCKVCHEQVLQSAKTTDISLSDKASCVTCHSAKGGVVSTCATCHDYHNKTPTSEVTGNSSVRKMMLGEH